MLHLAAATGAFMQTKMWTRWTHPLRRLTVNLAERSLFETAFAAVDAGADDFKGQGTLNEYHLAITLMGNPLSLQV